jgi:hypothetical protein
MTEMGMRINPAPARASIPAPTLTKVTYFVEWLALVACGMKVCRIKERE